MRADDAVAIADVVIGEGKRAGKLALAGGDLRLTYGDLRDRAGQTASTVADMLRQDGSLGEQDRAQPVIALLAESTPRLFAAFIGVTMAGAVALILDPRWSSEELQAAIAATKPDLFLSEPALAERLSTGDKALAEGRLVLLEEAASRYRPHDRMPEVPDDALFFIGFTSGTTGVPKGYARTHRSWLNSLRVTAAEFSVDSDERVLIPGRLHQSLFLWAVFETMANGASAYLLPRFDAREGLAHLRSGDLTRIHGVPTMCISLLNEMEQGECFPSVRADRKSVV